MTDYFALLKVPRRPWIDLDALKASFHRLSALAHPDRMTGASIAERQQAADSYTLLNDAYQTLKDSKSRLHHLICLERGSKPGDSQHLPESLMSLFATIGPLLRQADALVKEKAGANSALERALSASKALPCLQEITRTRAQLQQQTEQLEIELARLDEAWSRAQTVHTRGDEILTWAERLYHHLGFLDRWQAQLREREFELTL